MTHSQVVYVILYSLTVPHSCTVIYSETGCTMAWCYPTDTSCWSVSGGCVPPDRLDGRPWWCIECRTARTASGEDSWAPEWPVAPSRLTHHKYKNNKRKKKRKKWTSETSHQSSNIFFEHKVKMNSRGSGSSSVEITTEEKNLTIRKYCTHVSVVVFHEKRLHHICIKAIKSVIKRWERQHSSSQCY